MATKNEEKRLQWEESAQEDRLLFGRHVLATTVKDPRGEKWHAYVNVPYPTGQNADKGGFGDSGAARQWAEDEARRTVRELYLFLRD